LDYLRELESESIYILREVVNQFENPVLLFSGGKDSIVLVHLAMKAFYPGRIPFKLLHIDTGHNFPETLEFRDKLVSKLGLICKIALVQDSIDAGVLEEETGYNASRNGLQTYVLLNELREGKYDAAIVGGRRDEEKSRAKERIFSHRNAFGEWDPKNQRPELWNLFNGKMKLEEHFRIFPLSNWTEVDVWNYILDEQIEIPSLYFSHEREVFEREGLLMAKSNFIKRKQTETVFLESVRCRTIGDISCTGLWRSKAVTIESIISEIIISRKTERGARMDDKTSETSMEDRKLRGYF